MPKKTGLGRGIEAIFGDLSVEYEDRISVLELDLIEKSPFQPREEFEQEKLKELAESIKEKGVIQPIIVRESNGKYQIVAGERRFLAAKMAGLSSIPAIVRELSDEEAAEIALIENIQRKDLNPIEEALAYKRLMENFGYTQEELSKRIGKDRATIANTLRLLKLPNEVIEMLKSGQISAGHARALLALKDNKEQVKLAEKIKKEKLSVREAEKAAYDSKQIEQLKEIEEKLKTVTSYPAKIRFKNNKYKVEFVLDSLDKLDEFLRRIGG
ncbi:ParB/RepB/Spo0J family partition protein [Hippea maritima]|uniref:ParB-like partition protein n=1 Tax=Hippea maritima (strain ATCC 700847 / DSM 10411 / MH2) TaxID=760142 RepID=F2LW34_HIPMA|nr:ParB/RepB/Spo0J family partition protein [Hippea maritima]AEA33968.1 parB-like partition protein [Hippea maritima DSM 10411]